ncbi:hypothetical protein E4U21_004024 [Claviceps maximensis]|nr:hypothetical protein E4U21_004024 [Claviceps maximensis]
MQLVSRFSLLRIYRSYLREITVYSILQRPLSGLVPARDAYFQSICSKDGTISPSQVDLRRPSSRSEIRDRRNGIRRPGVRIYSPMQRTTRNSREQRNLPWVGSPRQQDRTGFSVSDYMTRAYRPYQRASLGITGSDDHSEEHVEEWIGLSHLDSWRDSPPPPPPPPTHPPIPPVANGNDNVTDGSEMGWWTLEPQLSTARPGRLDHQQSTVFEYPSWQSWRDSHIAEISSRTLPPMFSRTASGRDISLRAIGRQTTRGLSSTDLASVDGSRSRGLSARQSMPPRRASRMVDGLGDRDRSLSPEMWDTLLSTLTPEPQQPSAGSSFDSVPASQTAGPSSGTPSTNPDAVDEVQMETVCDSGCEYSDNEMSIAEYEHLDYDPRRRRHPPRELHSRRVPDFNLDGMSEPYPSNVRSTSSVHPLSGPAVPAPLAQRTRNSGDPRTSRQINTPSGSITIYESTMRLRPWAEVSRRSASPSRSTSHSNYDEASPPPQRSHFVQDEEHSPRSGPQQNQDVTRSASTAGPSPAEDDWVGMQRIVRSLARREDIPDGWWAEAGLSRILHQRADSSLDVHSITDPL